MPDVLSLPVLPAALAPRAVVVAIVPAAGLTPEAAYQAPAVTAATMTAGGAVSGQRALMTDGVGRVVHADPQSPALAFAGVSLQAAAAYAPVLVATAGQLVTEPTWSWMPGAALFLGPAGSLTASPPTVGLSQQVAQAITATTVLVQPYAPITLV